MATVVRPDELVQVLAVVLHPDVTLRQQAESFLKHAFTCQGTALSLLQIATAGNVDLGLRQLAAVILKQFIHKHWSSTSHSGFELPEVAEEEKAAVREAIFPGLCQAPASVRTSLSVCVAAIAKYDYPESWPGILESVLSVVRVDNNSPQAAAQRESGMCTLRLMSEDMDDSQLPSILRVLLPVILSGVQDPEASGMGGPMLRHALSTVDSCVSCLPMMEAAAQKELRAVVQPLLQPLLQMLCGVISAPLSAEDPTDWAIRLEAVKICQQLLMGCQKMMAPYISMVMQHCWKLFVEAYPVFEKVVLDDTVGDGGNMDGCGLESVVEQLYEFLLTIIGIKGTEASIAVILEPMLYHTIGYMQMTADQQHTWISDPNQYVADEEDEVFGARSSCEMLLQELQSRFEGTMTETLHRVVHQRLGETLQLRASSNPSWWRLREAALFALGTQMNLIEGESDPKGPDVMPILTDMLQNDLTLEGVPPFLRGRALWVAAKLGSQLPPEQALAFLPAAVEGLSSRNDAPVRIGACRAVAALCEKVRGELLTPHVEALYAGLIDLMQSIDHDILNLVLESLQAVIKAHDEAAAHYARQITAFLIRVFPLHASDMHLSSTIQSLFTTMSKQPTCVPPMVQEGVPPLLEIIKRHTSHLDMLVEGALDLLCAFVSNNIEVTREMYGLVAPTVVQMLLGSAEPSIVQSCTELLRMFVLRGGSAMLTWAGQSADATLEMLHRVAAHVLDPQLDDMAAMFVAGFLLQLLRSLPAEVAPSLPALLQLLVVKLDACKIEAIRGQLLVVLARIMVDTPMDTMVAMLSKCTVPDGGDALQRVIEIWMDNALDAQGPFQMRVCALALAKLLACRHSALEGFQVKGKPVAEAGSGVRTRSQAARLGSGLKQSMVPLPVKLAHVVVQLLKEADTSEKETDLDWRQCLYGIADGLGDDDDDDEYEDDDGDGDEDDENEQNGMGHDRAGASSHMHNLNAALLEGFEEDEDDEEWHDDPLYKADVVGLVKIELQQLMKSDTPYFRATLTELTKQEIAFMNDLFPDGAS